MARKTAKTKARRYTDKERLARFRRHLDPWASFMGLSQTWHIEVAMIDDGNEGNWAKVTMTYQYPKAIIQVNRKGIDSMVDYEVEAAAVHELLHILSNNAIGELWGQFVEHSPMRQSFENGMETLVDSIARIMVCLHNDKFLGPRYVGGGK